MILDERLEDFILTKFDQKTLQKPNIIEQLGQCMTEAGHEFSPSNPYGIVGKTIRLRFSRLTFFFYRLNVDQMWSNTSKTRSNP